MKNIKIHKSNKKRICVCVVVIIIINMNFIIPSFMNKVYGEEDTEEQTSQIIQSQSETLRYIKLYRRSRKIPK